MVPARAQTKDFDCKCKCSTKLFEQEYEDIFKRFNEMPTYSEQTLFLQGLCRPVPVARSRKRIVNGGKGREVTYIYYFEVNRQGVKEEIKVCKKAFLNILGITESRLRKKVQDNREDHQDGRGSHKNRPNRTPEDALEKVRNFIKNLPARESHWSRKKNTKRKYLDASATITGLHEEFMKKHPELAGTKEAYSDAVIKPKRFYEIFTSEFNIGIGYPRSDKCDVRASGCEAEES